MSLCLLHLLVDVVSTTSAVARAGGTKNKEEIFNDGKRSPCRAVQQQQPYNGEMRVTSAHSRCSGAESVQWNQFIGPASVSICNYEENCSFDRTWIAGGSFQ